MKKITFLTLLLWGFFAHAAPYRLMIFGDSLSAGYKLTATQSYASQLQQALEKSGYKNVTIINYSKSGETTTGGVSKIQSALNQKPDGVILELGINDALRGADISVIQKNLETIISTFQDNQIPVLLIGMQVPTQAPVYRQNFTKMYQDVAQKYDLYFYPFFMKDVLKVNLRQMTFDTTLLQSDGAHPTAKGVSIMVQNTLPTVIAFLRKNGISK